MSDWIEAATRMQNQAHKAEAERDRLREALLIIAGQRQPADNLMSDKDIARAALTDTDRPVSGEKRIQSSRTSVGQAGHQLIDDD